MADLTVTATSVLHTSGEVGTANAGEAITAGVAIYLTTAGLVMKAQNDATAIEAQAKGIALNGGAVGQPIVYAKHGAVINPGATLELGEVYVVSATAGGIGVLSELAENDRITILGYALTTSSLKIHIIETGTVHGA